jgi:hypothetical protein
MSNANELMRLVVHEITAYGQVTYKTLEQIENFLAAEPEAEPTNEIDGLARACNLAGIGYKDFLRIKAYMPISPKNTDHFSGLAEALERLLEWHSRMDQTEYTGDHPVSKAKAALWVFKNKSQATSPKPTEPEADEPVAWIDKYSLAVLKNGTEEIRTGVYIGNVVGVKSHSSDTRNIPLYTRPEPARKPMTEEYINAVAKAKGLNRLEAHFFLEGIRYAEKHYEIGRGME